jgi:hypothetical protein
MYCAASTAFDPGRVSADVTTLDPMCPNIGGSDIPMVILKSQPRRDRIL